MEVSDIKYLEFSEEDIQELIETHGKAFNPAYEYCQRQAGNVVPAGSYDKSGRFHITEISPCCWGLHPDDHFNHGISIEHCAKIHCADIELTKAAVRDFKRISKKYC